MESWLTQLLDAAQMREADRWAIEERGVPSLELMETAGAAVAQVAREVSGEGRAVVVCGKGNNGGDGLVAARLLDRDRHRDAEALLLWPPEELSGDAAANLERFPAARHVDPKLLAAELEGAGVVIDAVFGTGFADAPREPIATALEAIAECAAPVVAADIASGVDASTGEIAGAAARADVTVTFHAAKLGHRVAPGRWNAGELRVIDIGIPADAPVPTRSGQIDPGVLRLAPRRTPRSTKFTSGKVVVIGGSRGLTGAVCLCAEAATRAGAGYAIVAVPAGLETIFELKLTEVMSLGCPGDERLEPEGLERILETCDGAAAVVLGPGLGREPTTQELARELSRRVNAPLVIDADGLNAHVGHLDALAGRDQPTVMTPHAGELARLLETDSEAVSNRRLASATELASRCDAVVVLKGDGTLVVEGDHVGVDSISSPGLATAGTGDVLAGMVAALIGRGMEPFAGSCAAVVAHSRAGRIAGDRLGAESVVAGDVLDSIPTGLVV